jgi:phospholipase A-2-activating protein
VISLSWSASGHLISGSWDGTAKIWDVAKGEVLQTLEGHENGVCVLGLPNGDIATGSTGREEQGKIVDVQIRLWREGKEIKAIKEHTGPVRSLALMPDLGFLSTSNDGTVRLYSFDGDVLGCVQSPPSPDGSPPFVYKAGKYTYTHTHTHTHTTHLPSLSVSHTHTHA